MSRLRFVFITLLASFAVLMAGCDQTPSSDTDKVLATVNGENIRQSDYQNYLQLRQQQVGPITDAAQEKKIIMDEMIEKILLAQYAVESKLDQDPEVGTLLRRVREEILVQAVKRKQLKDQPITDDDIKKRFEQEVKETHKTEYKVRHILVKEEAEAKDILSRLGKGTKFEKLAKEKSIDTHSAKNGGQLDWINQGMVVPEFFTAVTALKKGMVSSAPVKTDFGWHIIKVEDTRPLEIPSFEQIASDQRARSTLTRKLQEDRMNSLVKNLREKAKITVK